MAAPNSRKPIHTQSILILFFLLLRKLPYFSLSQRIKIYKSVKSQDEEYSSYVSGEMTWALAVVGVAPGEEWSLPWRVVDFFILAVIL